MAETGIHHGGENHSEDIDVTDFTCGTVCIVDDDPANLDLLGAILSGNCYNIFTAQNGESALSIIDVQQPDLILLDIIISPEEDGYEICKKLKSSEKTSDIPVIFISALDETVDKMKAFKAGGVDYITKPFQMEEVLARVQTHILNYQIQKQLVIQYESLRKEIRRRKHVEKELERANKQLERIVTIDPLTGLNNRKHFMTHVLQEWRRMVREKRPLALLLCDIDNFDEFNALHGTHAGDAVLQELAKIVKKTARRPGDIVARWGEDEFSMLLPCTDSEGALILAENVLNIPVDVPLPDSAKKKHGRVNLSIGIASTVPSYGLQMESIINQVSEALLRAKNSSETVIIFEE